MAKKEFTYRGLKLEQLQQMGIKEFAQLVPSRERRTLVRGLTTEQKNLLRKLEKRDKVKTHQREMIILPQMVGKTIMVHMGKSYQQLLITEEMLGNRLGEYVLSKKFARHSSPGVGGKTKVSVK
ncbi:30S ribosomal protein S19 [Candidatus Woesearchaeota archaeon]|nr:30S ribosomal protein S19 [Candidatus Woesearchaeota archaeon]